MKKRYAVCSVLCLLLACALLLCGCSYQPPYYLFDARINENGELVLTYSDGREETLGTVVGKDGKNGRDGTDGTPGAPGLDGKDGKDGLDGADGEAGATVIEGTNAVAAAAQKGLRSTVCVTAVFTEQETGEFYGSTGSGVIYRMNKAAGSAFIITNYHLVYDEASDAPGGISTEIDVYLYGSMYLYNDDDAIRATYVGGSAYYDIAVLYVENSEQLRTSDALPVTVTDSDTVLPGDVAIVVGNPDGSGHAASSGIVSVDSEHIMLSISPEPIRVIRVDAPVNLGSSGGGLFNDRGELIGIVNSKTISHGVESMGYAIPTATAAAVADNIIDHCFGTQETAVMRPLLGITISIEDSKGVYDKEHACMRIVETIVVHEISETSVMKGKLAVGDVLVRMTVAGVSKDITRRHHLLDFMLTARVGDTLTYTVLRDGAEHTFSVTVTASMISKT